MNSETQNVEKYYAGINNVNNTIVNKYNLMYYLLIVAVLLQGLFFHIVNPTRLTTILLMIDIFVLFMISMSLGYKVESQFLNRYIFAVILLVLVPQTLYGFNLGQNIDDYIDVIKGLIYLFISVPVLKLFLKNRQTDKLLNTITILTTISLLILLINSYTLNEYRISVLPFDYFKMPSTFRGNRIRLYLISDFLSFISIYSFSNILHSKNKINFIFPFVIAIIAEIYIEQTRMILISISASCLIMSTFWIQNRIRRLILSIITILVIIFGYYLEWFNFAFNTFSISNQNLGVSTLYRTIELRYAIKQIVEHPLLGTGMIKNRYIPVSMDGVEIIFDHTDIGLLGSISYIGLIGFFVLFLWPYIRCLKIVKIVPKGEKISRDYIFILGLFTYISLTSLTIIITDNARIFVWPFILAIFEFYKYQNSIRLHSV